MNLISGQHFEFHSAPMETTTEYELESSEGAGVKGAYARLRNVETDAISRVLCHSLRHPDNWPSKSYWKRVES